MSTDNLSAGPRRAVRALDALGLLPALGTALRRDAAGITSALVADVRQQVAAFSESRNPDVLPELAIHVRDLVAAAAALLEGRRSMEFEFVTAHAERRAAQKFPLDALLQAYRCAHRVLAERIRDAAIGLAGDDLQLTRVVAAVSDFTIELTGLLGTRITADYVHFTRRLAEAEGDQRTRLLSTLLDGYDESDPQAATLLRSAGYLQQRLSFCVAVARSVDAAEMLSLPRADRMADALRAELDTLPLRVLVGVREHLVVAVVAGTRRQSGWTSAQALLAEQLLPPLRRIGPAAVIGVSTDAPSTSHIPRALQEARLALDLADVANRVVRFDDVPLRRLLVSQGRHAIRAALPAWSERLSRADGRGVLRATLRAYADNNMNAQRSARSLGVHPNTIYARMSRVEELTGRNPLDYHALTEILLALDCAP